MKEGSKKKMRQIPNFWVKKKNFLLLEFVRFFFTGLEKKTERVKKDGKKRKKEK